MPADSTPRAVRPSPWALLPLLLFLALYFGTGLYNLWHGVERAFYQLPAAVAILPAVVLALALGRGAWNDRVDTFLRGIGDVTIVTMVVIFLLAGAFATVMEAIGAVEATVNLGLLMLPGALLLPGLFLTAAFVSTAMGTSVGTVAAIVPVAVGVSSSAGLSLPLTVGAVIGGAMFGDNLSIISDTTIAATRTQGCSMKDKFRANLVIALPAAALTALLLLVLGRGAASPAVGAVDLPLVVPYLAVLGLALLGLNVLVVLGAGLVLAAATGFVVAGYTLAGLVADVYAGFESMLGIMLLAMFVGGLGALMKRQGGLAWITDALTRLARGRGPRTGAYSIAALVTASDVFTANNVVSILLSGEVARDLAGRYGLTPARSASVLDVFACSTQGLLPYGAQILLAGSLTQVSPLALIGAIHYCWLLGLVALFAIWYLTRDGAPAQAEARAEAVAA